MHQEVKCAISDCLVILVCNIKMKRNAKPCCCRAVIDGGSVVAVATGVITGIVLAPETRNFN